MKKVIIAIIVVLLFVAILIGGGLFFYLKTDFIQSDKKMFFKYMSELPEFFEDKNLKQYSEKIKNTPYTSEGTIKVNAEFVDESNKSLEPYLKNCSINLKGSSDAKQDYYVQNIEAKYSDKQSLNFELIKDKDIIALKENETIDKFIGFENKNLKEFAKKMGLEDDYIKIIPDKISLTEMDNVSSNIFTKEEIKIIKEKYFKIISDSLTDDMFSKGETEEGKVYTFTIKNQKIQEIRLNILKNLQEDEMIFNAIKKYFVENKILEEDEIDLEDYKDIFKEMIEEYNSEEEKPDNVDISIKTYTKNNKLNKINLSFNVKDENSENKNLDLSINIQKISTTETVNYLFSAELDGKKLLELNIDYKGINTNQITEAAKCNIEYNEDMFYYMELEEEKNDKIEVTYNNQIIFVDKIQKTELSDKNLGLINDIESMEELENTFKKITLKFEQVNMRKMVNAGIEENVNPFKYYSVAAIPIISCENIKNNDYLIGYSTIGPISIMTGASIAMISGDISIRERAENAINKSDKYTFNSNFTSFDGNGISAKKANKLIKNINQNNTDNDRKVLLYTINSKGKSKLVLDEKNIKEINLPDSMYYYITMEKDKDGYIKKIYIQQGQKSNLSSSDGILERAQMASKERNLTNAQEMINGSISDQIAMHYNKIYIDSNSEGEDTIENAILVGVKKAKEGLECKSEEGESYGDYLDIKYDESKMEIIVSYDNYQVIGKISKNGIVAWGEIKEI